MLIIKRGATQLLNVTLTDENNAPLVLAAGDSVQLRFGIQGQTAQARTMTAGGGGVFSYTFVPADSANMNGPSYTLEAWFLTAVGAAYPMLEYPLKVANSLLAP